MAVCRRSQQADRGRESSPVDGEIGRHKMGALPEMGLEIKR